VPSAPIREADLRLVGNSLELGFIELLSECFTLSEQAGVGSKQLMELIKDQHKSPALLRYADRITENRFDSRGGFNLAGGIADARYVYLILYLPPFDLPYSSLLLHSPVVLVRLARQLAQYCIENSDDLCSRMITALNKLLRIILVHLSLLNDFLTSRSALLVLGSLASLGKRADA
jgi:hypothetical protein